MLRQYELVEKVLEYDPDADEAIEAVRLTIAEAAEAVRRGAIVDAKSLVAVAAAERLATR